MSLILHILRVFMMKELKTLTQIALCTILCGAATTKPATKTSVFLRSIIGGGVPEASSTLLKMQRIYNRESPHDMSLYNALRVSPNATVADITKSYRYISRELHPDKRKYYRRKTSRKLADQNNNCSVSSPEERDRSSSSVPTEDPDERLELVHQAYDVLKDDATRLLYHRFGLLDTTMAAMLLTGGQYSASSPGAHSFSPEQRRLMELMGHQPYYHNSDVSEQHQQRVMFIAANLVEMLRPLVEGVVSQENFAHQLASEFEMLKSLPLGAQIIRCVGRAYRRSGQRLLQRHRRWKTKNLLGKPSLQLCLLDLTDGMRDNFRSAQYIATAAMASGKLILKEQASKYRKEAGGRVKNVIHDILPSIGYYMHDDNEDTTGMTSPSLAEIFGDMEEFELLSGSFLSNGKIQEREREKAESAVISTLQVDALWKISKIELDRTIREACNLVLSGDYFFFPTHYGSKLCNSAQRQQSPPMGYGCRNNSGDGWVVSSTGQVIETDVGRLRSAAALVLVGDMLVQCSKEGTSWKE